MALRLREEFRDYQSFASDVIVDRLLSAGSILTDGQALLLKPGLGKTPVALDVVSRMRPRRTLVVAPAQVANAKVWSREAMAWLHLCNLSVTEITGTEEDRHILLMLGSQIEVISYDNLMWLTDTVKRNRYDSVIYDELQMMKHPGTKRFKRMRAWASDYSLKLGLTGSPLGNHWLDLWGEMFIVAGEKALGPTKEQYISNYFNAIRNGDRIGYEIRQDGSIDQIRQRIKPYAFSLRPRQVLDALPKVIPVTHELEVPDKCRKLEAKLQRELEVELDSGKTLTALNNSKLSQAVRQFASGAVYTGEVGDTSQWEELHDIKLEKLADVVSELQGEPILVFVWFKHELARILKRFPGAEVLHGDTETVDRWNRKEIPILVAHPQGGGRGLNLQKGSSSIFWFTLPWSRELFDQGNGREARIGQPDEFVTAHVPLAGPIDRRVWSRVLEKGADEEGLFSSVELEMA
jgi:SNF2 family DNA or RNA helicase